MFAVAWVMLSFSQVHNLLVKITVKLPVVKVELLQTFTKKIYKLLSKIGKS